MLEDYQIVACVEGLMLVPAIVTHVPGKLFCYIIRTCTLELIFISFPHYSGTCMCGGAAACSGTSDTCTR